jgi:murein DD-endopeptidase MepM/ murein hydrolase activator NlpD
MPITPFDFGSFGVAAIINGFSEDAFDAWKDSKETIEESKPQTLDRTYHSNGSYYYYYYYYHGNHSNYSHSNNSTKHNNTHNNWNGGERFNMRFNAHHNVPHVNGSISPNSDHVDGYKNGSHRNDHSNGPYHYNYKNTAPYPNSHANYHYNGYWDYSYYYHTNKQTPVHSNTHSNDGSPHYNHSDGTYYYNYGFDHGNYIPSKPYIFAQGSDASPNTALNGTVTLGFYSYDKSKASTDSGSPQISGVSQAVQYYVRIRKVRNLDNTPSVSSWRVLLNWSAQETFDLDTLYPLGSGVSTPKSNEGYYEIEVTARNPQYSANGMTRTYESQKYTVEVKIQQNAPPSIEVKNGNEFINFIFGEEGAYSIAGNYYKTYEEGLYAEASDTQKEGLFVVVSITDTDIGDWQKGSIKLQLPDGNDIPGTMTPIIWADTGTQVTKSSGVAKKGYAFIPSSLFVEPYDTYIDDAKAVVSVTDYSDQNCTVPISTVTQIKESALATARMLVFDIDKNMTHDTVAGEVSIHKTPTYIYTKWHKDEDGNPAKMDISLTWNDLKLLTLQGDGTVLNEEPITVTRVESEHILNRYTEIPSTANGELVSENLPAVGAGSGTYQATYQYEKAGDENSPFIFRLYYTVNGEERHVTIRVNIPVNGMTTTLRKGNNPSSVFKKAVTNTADINTWQYNGVLTLASGSDDILNLSGSNNDMLWPLPGHTEISSYFGRRIDPINGKITTHHGIDIPAAEGTAIVSPVAGTVVYAGQNNDYGNMLVIRSGGYDFLFGHCSSLLVTAGQPIAKGQIIAKVGSTGRSTGPHLHLGVSVGPYTQGNYIDPLTVVNP